MGEGTQQKMWFKPAIPADNCYSVPLRMAGKQLSSLEGLPRLATEPLQREAGTTGGGQASSTKTMKAEG